MNNHLSLITAHAWRYLSYRGNPLDAQAQERQAGRKAQAHAQDYVMFWYHILFCALPFLLYDTHRDEDHKPGGRASDVSTISTCVSYMLWFTAHSPTQSLWERAGGITIVYLCGF